MINDTCSSPDSPRSPLPSVADLAGRATGVDWSELVADRIRGALAYIAPTALAVSPDCGMKFLPRSVARAKLEAMVAGAGIVRAELI